MVGMEAKGGAKQGLQRRRPEPLPSFADSLACLKNCMNFTLGPVRPTVDQFHKYLPWFLEDLPNIKCPKG